MKIQYLKNRTSPPNQATNLTRRGLITAGAAAALVAAAGGVPAAKPAGSTIVRLWERRRILEGEIEALEAALVEARRRFKEIKPPLPNGLKRLNGVDIFNRLPRRFLVEYSWDPPIHYTSAEGWQWLLSNPLSPRHAGAAVIARDNAANTEKLGLTQRFEAEIDRLRESTGLKQAEAALNAAYDESHDIQDEIMKSPVVSTVDLSIKLEMLWGYDDGLDGPDNPWDDHFRRVRDDAKRLAGMERQPAA